MRKNIRIQKKWPMSLQTHRPLTWCETSLVFVYLTDKPLQIQQKKMKSKEREKAIVDLNFLNEML